MPPVKKSNPVCQAGKRRPFLKFFMSPIAAAWLPRVSGMLFADVVSILTRVYIRLGQIAGDAAVSLSLFSLAPAHFGCGSP